MGKVEWKGILLSVICCHVPNEVTSEEHKSFYQCLTTLMLRHPKPDYSKILILGDFNSHLGSDVRSCYSTSVGLHLFHSVTNPAGYILYDFLYSHRLQSLTTFTRNHAKTTWISSNGNQSQLDMIICPITKTYVVTNIKAFKNLFSDHKVVWFSFKWEDPIYNPNRFVTNCSGSSAAKLSKGKWQLDLFKAAKSLKAFHQKCCDFRESQQYISTWTELVELLTTAADSVLADTKLNDLTPRRAKALTTLKKTLVRKNKGLALAVEVSECRRNLHLEWNRFRNDECKTFFERMNDYHYSERIKRTCKFIRSYRKRKSGLSTPNIPMSAWITVLNDSRGTHLGLIDEKDGVPFIPPPTYLEISTIIHRMKRGKCAGKDRIPVEFFKSLPEDVVNDLVRIYQRVWTLNDPPKQWQDTVQIPIPKVVRPRDVLDYRRITICQVGYRLYAYWILDKLYSFFR